MVFLAYRQDKPDGSKGLLRNHAGHDGRLLNPLCPLIAILEGTTLVGFSPRQRCQMRVAWRLNQER